MKKNKLRYLRYYAYHKDLIDKTVVLLRTIKKQLGQLKEYTRIVETNVDSLTTVLGNKEWEEDYEK